MLLLQPKFKSLVRGLLVCNAVNSGSRSANRNKQMATITRENTGLLTDKITVQLAKADYYPAFEKALKNYSKNAKIPGFRPGMVPLGVVKKMYGTSVFTDEVLRTVEKEINSYLEKEKPEIFAQPMPLDENGDTLRQLDVNKPEDYTFSFEIGLKPDFSIAPLNSATINRRVVTVTEEMVNEEIERLVNRYGNMKDLESVEGSDNVINFTFTEVDSDGNEVAGGITKDNSLLVSYFSEAVRPQLNGLKKDDTLVVTLGEAFTGKEKEAIISDLGLEGTEDADSKQFKLTITKVGLVEKRELNEEFFNQVLPGKAIATEAEFRNAVKEDIQAYWANQARGQVHDEIYHYLIDNTDIQYPEAFLKRWLQNGGEKPKTAEEVDAEFPSFVNSLKWTLITDKLIRENGLQVQPEELRAFAKHQMMGYMGVTALDESTAWLDAYVDRMMKDQKYLDQNYNQLLTDKLFGYAEQQVTNYNETPVTVDEFQALAHHHHH